jgi:hypothetical protein
MGGEDRPALPRRREPDLSGLAMFTMDSAGRLTSWSPTAAGMFGHQADAVIGRHLSEVLLTGPGQDSLVERALAEVAEGRVWSTTVAGGSLGEGRFAVRCEPDGGQGGVLVLIERAWPQPSPAWLRDAAERIGRTLDLYQTAAEVIDVAVPGFADSAGLYVTDRLLVADEFVSAKPGTGVVVRRLAARLAGQSEEATNDRLPAGEVLFLAEGSRRLQAISTGQPVLFDWSDEMEPEQLARQSGVYLEQAAAGYTFLAVPLAARGAVVGCAVFGRSPGGPGFSPGEVTLALELSSRAALALDNARLYDRERRTAQALQRGLMPGLPQIPPGLEVAQKFLPVGDSVVGGDWHDIVPLPGGRAALIVGDAMGHGPEAAAVMVQLRTAAHILAGRALPPGEILRSLDSIVAQLPGVPSFATCITTVIDPASGSCLAAQAGHLPPVLVRPGGQTEVLDLPTGLPLGLGADSFDPIEVPFPPGTTLALYTDGLVENRSRPIEGGLAALCDALSTELSKPGRDLDEACEAVARRLREGGEDDATLVLVRIRQPAGADAGG